MLRRNLKIELCEEYIEDELWKMEDIERLAHEYKTEMYKRYAEIRKERNKEEESAF